MADHWIQDYGADPLGVGDSRPAIALAIATAAPGDRIMLGHPGVAPADYTEPVVYSLQTSDSRFAAIDLRGKRLSIVGPGRDLCSVRHHGPGQRTIISSQPYDLANFEVQHVLRQDPGEQSHCAVVANYGPATGGFSVRRMRFLCSGGDGFYSLGVDQQVIEDVEGDTARCVVAVGSVGHWRRGFTLVGVRRVGTQYVPVGQRPGPTIDFEPRIEPVNGCTGIDIRDCHGPGSIHLMNCWDVTLEACTGSHLSGARAQGVAYFCTFEGNIQQLNPDGTRNPDTGTTIKSTGRFDFAFIDCTLRVPDGGYALVNARRSGVDTSAPSVRLVRCKVERHPLTEAQDWDGAPLGVPPEPPGLPWLCRQDKPGQKPAVLRIEDLAVVECAGVPELGQP